MEERDKYGKYVGKLIDNRYRIEKVIGSGGMAVVFKAEDTAMNKTVAIKMLKEEKQNDPSYMKGFINEARAVAMLNHENIVHIYDVSVRDGLQYIVMEYIEGMTLKTYLEKKGGILEWREVLNITEQILRALEHAHSKKVVHRDIKPQNIMLLKNGLIKVADFGIAKLPGNDTITAADKAIGTVHYISPEQARNEPIDDKSDLYSVGIMMYELACGKLPFTAESPVSVALMQVEATAEPPRSVNDKLPVGMEQIIMRAMEKDPARRYQSAKSMLRHISALKENENIRFRTPPAVSTEEEKKKEPETEKNEKIHTVVEGRAMMPIILGALSAFLIVAIIIAFLVFNKLADSMNAPNGTDVTVENFVGKVYDDALVRSMEAQGYRITVKEGTAEDGSPMNLIVYQDPKEGSVKKYIQGEKPIDITLYVYNGSDTVKLADLAFKEYAALKVEYATLYKFEKVDEHSNTVPEGYVIRTEPAAGSDVTMGTEIKVIVSKGPNEKKVEMKSLIGMSGSAARDWLVNNGLKLGYITFVNSSVPKGNVVSQSVAVRTDVPLGTSVNIVISNGPSAAEQSADTENSPAPASFDWLE